MAGQRREPGEEGAGTPGPGPTVAVRIGQAVVLHRGGDREEARNRLARLWEEAGAAGDPFLRCLLAHHLAGVQDDPAAGLEWQRRALAAARGPVAGRGPSPRSLLPSLHLGLAECHARLGDRAAARRELARARSAAEGPPGGAPGGGADGREHAEAYRALVQATAGRLERWLAATGHRAGPPERFGGPAQPP